MKFVEFSTFLFRESATLLLWSLNTFGLRHRQAFIHINGLAFFLGNRGTNLLGNILTFLSRDWNKISRNENDDTSKAAVNIRFAKMSELIVMREISILQNSCKKLDIVSNQISVETLHSKMDTIFWTIHLEPMEIRLGASMDICKKKEINWKVGNNLGCIDNLFQFFNSIESGFCLQSWVVTSRHCSKEWPSDWSQTWLVTGLHSLV